MLKHAIMFGALAAATSACSSENLAETPQYPTSIRQTDAQPRLAASGTETGTDAPTGTPTATATGTGADPSTDPSTDPSVVNSADLRAIPASRFELHRVLLHNVVGGLIKGSRDGGETWTVFGKVIRPITGQVWRPTVDAGVLAFNYLRGPSNVFASAVNSIHLRLSDPAGYTLPADPHAPLIEPKGLSIVPKEISPDNHGNAPGRAAFTDIPGGKLLFGADWAPKVGSAVFMGDGTRFAPIPYEQGPTDVVEERSYLLLVTEEDEVPVQYYEFENKIGGQVKIKRVGQSPVQVAKVLQPVKGVGRFSGSEFLPQPGAIRASHAGVFDIGTTDIAQDRPPNMPILELRGGFQIVPSHHYCDASMRCGGDHPQVYMVVGPVQDPPNLDRYDMGLEGSAPLFRQAVRAGIGRTYMMFTGDDAWYEINDAIKLGKFKTRDGTVVRHLRGVLMDVLENVRKIRLVVQLPAASRG